MSLNILFTLQKLLNNMRLIASPFQKPWNVFWLLAARTAVLVIVASFWSTKQLAAQSFVPWIFALIYWITLASLLPLLGVFLYQLPAVWVFILWSCPQSHKYTHAHVLSKHNANNLCGAGGRLKITSVICICNMCLQSSIIIQYFTATNSLKQSVGIFTTCEWVWGVYHLLCL